MIASANAQELFVSAASSLTDAMKEIGGRYEKRNPDKIVFNFGASSLLARQIEEGVPADVFVSADEAQMDRLDRSGRIERGTRRDLLTNALVIVVRKDSPLAINDVSEIAGANISRIALADPQSVPAGIYAREFLIKAKVWERVRDRVVPAENVRAALAVVEAGNADLGIVYITDATLSNVIRIAFRVAPEMAPRIVYPGAIIANSSHREAATRFLTFLRSNEAAEIFQKAGFGIAQ
jgi:molybdate transport system substrate-binding protein